MLYAQNKIAKNKKPIENENKEGKEEKHLTII